MVYFNNWYNELVKMVLLAVAVHRRFGVSTLYKKMNLWGREIFQYANRPGRTKLVRPGRLWIFFPLQCKEWSRSARPERLGAANIINKMDWGWNNFRLVRHRTDNWPTARKKKKMGSISIEHRTWHDRVREEYLAGALGSDAHTLEWYMCVHVLLKRSWFM